MVDPLKWLKIAALFEGSSLVALLFIAMPLKYYMGLPEAVSFVGAAHGGLFSVFIAILLAHLAMGRINAATTSVGVIASFIPFGTFIYVAKYLRVSKA